MSSAPLEAQAQPEAALFSLRRHGRALTLPVLVLLIPLVNLAFWTMSKLWPSSKAMASGYQLELRKA